MLYKQLALATLVGSASGLLAPPAAVRAHTHAPATAHHLAPRAAVRMDIDIERRTGDNVEQIKDTKRDKVMTFSYDMSLEPKYDKPTYPGTGNGLGGDTLQDEYDVIVIGSGMGGLACGALSAEYGSNVAVLESHIKPGGSAHTFSRMHNGGKYSFEVGPSIFEGLNGPSFNPLRTILDMLGEDLKCETYTGLGYWTPEGYWRFPIGSQQKFEDLIYERCGKEEGDKAVAEWAALRKRLKTLGGSTMAVSLLNLRQDAGMLATTAGATPYVLKHPDIFADLPLTFDSLHKTVDEIITVPFLRNYIDTMCIFCGFPAKGAMTAHILYILERFFEEGCAFCVPLGGTVEMAYAFQRALEKRGGDLSLNTHVDELVYDADCSRCVGVKLKSGRVIKAKKAVVSNATPFDTVKMLPDGGDAPELPEGVREWKKTLGKLPRHGAIMHLFLAIDAEGLDLSHIDDPAHLVVQDWDRSLQDSQNLCSFFIPSLRDPSVCPPGKHCIHVYSQRRRAVRAVGEVHDVNARVRKVQGGARGGAVAGRRAVHPRRARARRVLDHRLAPRARGLPAARPRHLRPRVGGGHVGALLGQALGPAALPLPQPEDARRRPPPLRRLVLPRHRHALRRRVGRDRRQLDPLGLRPHQAAQGHRAALPRRLRLPRPRPDRLRLRGGRRLVDALRRAARRGGGGGRAHAVGVRRAAGRAVRASGRERACGGAG